MDFPAPHIYHPQAPHTHTHTVILLHGRASSGPEFSEDFLSSSTSTGKNISSCLLSYRWVFPTSRDRWSTTFQEEMCSWFDAYSLSDIDQRQELQKGGLRESVLHILNIVEEEARLLDGQLSHLYLGGISQGMATALWAFFAAIGSGRIQKPLGGLLGFCGWLPFAGQLEGLLFEPTRNGAHGHQPQDLVSAFFFNEIAGHRTTQNSEPIGGSVLSTPVFLTHGTDDVWVPVELGRQASKILQKIMASVEWHEFSGAESDGHWIKEPEGFDRILEYLIK